MLKSLFPWKHGKHNKTKVMAEQTMEEGDEQEQQLLPCHVCGRTFLPLPLQKHTPVCEKHSTKKRKVFDSLKQRVEGTDLAPFHQRSYLKKNQESAPTEACPTKQNSKWKEKHLELVNAIRAAKGVSPDVMTPTAQRRAPVKGVSSTHERCPSCDRQFGPKAFDRHVEWCREHRARIQKSPANQLAKERLEARTKYKVPPLRQSKRAFNRDKYSPTGGGTVSRADSITSVRSTTTLTTGGFQRSPSIRKPRSVVSLNKFCEGSGGGGGGERRDKSLPKIEKCGDESSAPRQRESPGEKAIPKEIIKYSPKLEPSKGFQTKRTLPAKKINSPRINSEVKGITVSPLSLYTSGGGKKMVTWKDTLDASKEDGGVKIHSVVKSEVVFDKIQNVQIAQNNKNNIQKKVVEKTRISMLDSSVKTSKCDTSIPIKTQQNFRKTDEAQSTKMDQVFKYKKLEDIEINEKFISDKLIKKRTTHALHKYKLTKESAEKSLLHLQKPAKSHTSKDVKLHFTAIRSERNEKYENDDGLQNIDQGYTGSRSSEDRYESSSDTNKNNLQIKSSSYNEKSSTNDSGIIEDQQNVNICKSFTEERTDFLATSPRERTRTKINDPESINVNCVGRKTSYDIYNTDSHEMDLSNLQSSWQTLPNIVTNTTTELENTLYSDMKNIVTVTVLENCDNKLYYIAQISPRLEDSTLLEDDINGTTGSQVLSELHSLPTSANNLENTASKGDQNIMVRNADDVKKSSTNFVTKEVKLVAQTAKQKSITYANKKVQNQEEPINYNKYYPSSIAEYDDIINQSKSLSTDTSSTADYKKEIEMYLTNERINQKRDKKKGLYVLSHKITRVPSKLDDKIMFRSKSASAISITASEDSNSDLMHDTEFQSQILGIAEAISSSNSTDLIPKRKEVEVFSFNSNSSLTLSKDSIEESAALFIKQTKKCNSETQVSFSDHCTFFTTVSKIDTEEMPSIKSPQLLVIHECNELDEKETDKYRTDEIQNHTSVEKSFVSLYRNESSKKSDIDSVDVRCLYYDNVKSELKLRPCRSDILLRKKSSKFVTKTHFDLTKYASVSSGCSDPYNYSISDVCSNDASISSFNHDKIATNQFTEEYQKDFETTPSTSAEEFDYYVPKKRRKLDVGETELTETNYVNEQFTSTGSICVSKLEYLQSNIEKIKCMRAVKFDKAESHEDISPCGDSTPNVNLESIQNSTSNVNLESFQNENISRPEAATSNQFEKLELETRERFKEIDCDIKLTNRFLSAPIKQQSGVIDLDYLRKPLPPLKLPNRPPSSASSNRTCDIDTYTPRLLTILDKISRLNNRFYAPNEHATMEPTSVVEVPITVCEKLLEIDNKKLPRIFRKLEERRNHKKYEEPVKLPKIENSVSKDISIAPDSHISPTKECLQTSPEKLRTVEDVESPKNTPKEVGDQNVYIKENVEASSVKKIKPLDPIDESYPRKESSPSPTRSNYDPFASAQRQFMELLQCDDFKAFNITNHPLQHSPRPHTAGTTTKSPLIPRETIKSAEISSQKHHNDKINNKTKRGSVIDPPQSFQDIIDYSDSYIHDKLQNLNDDFELIENLINKQYIDNTIRDHNIINSNFQLSHDYMNDSIDLKAIISEQKYSDDMSSSSIDPCLINENDNLSIPENLKVDQYSPSSIDTDVTLRNEDDNANNEVYSVQCDKKVVSLGRERSPKSKKPEMKRSISATSRASTTSTHSNKSAHSTQANAKHESFRKSPSPKMKTRKSPQKSDSSAGKNKDKKNNLLSLKKSLSLLDPTPKPTMKNRADVNNYFEEQQLKSPSKNEAKVQEKKSEPNVQQQTETRLPIRAEDLFAVDDEMYEEYKRYEEIYLKEKREKSSNKKQRQKSGEITYGLLNASEEDDSANQPNKISNDSAYGSLNRKTPKHRAKSSKLSPLEQKHGVDSTSSSGSEASPVSPIVSNNPTVSCMKMSKFCHECGNKYPVDTAKFCVECGIRRLVL